MPRISHATTTERSSVSAASTSAAGEAGRARAQGQARRAEVLGLHGQQVADELRDARRARAVQELGRGPGATQRLHPRARATTSAGVICGVTLRRGKA